MASMFEILAVANRYQNNFTAFMSDMGYETKTTFYLDFTICDLANSNTERISAVKDTYNRAFKAWKNNVEYISELVIVLNHKIWQHYEKNEELTRVYNDLWERLSNWCYDNLKGEDLNYFCRVTD